MSPALLFYISCFFIAFFAKIPVGPVNLEVLQNSVKKYHAQALSVAVGAALGDGIWVSLAFVGMSPFIHNRYLEAIFLLITAIITFIMGYSALKNSRFIEKAEEEIVRKIRKKRWAFLKGLTLILINPLVLVTWMISLSFLRKSKVYIPIEINYKILLFIVVAVGTISYFSLVVFITKRIKSIFNERRTKKITRVLAYLLIACSLYFLFFSIKLLLFKGDLMSLTQLAG